MVVAKSAFLVPLLLLLSGEDARGSPLGLAELFGGRTKGPVSWERIADVFEISNATASREGLVRILQKIQNVTRDIAESSGEFPPHAFYSDSANESIAGPEFRWIPAYQASAIPNGASGEWKAPCFQKNKITATFGSDGKTLEVEVEVSDKKSLLCSDWYVLATGSGIKFETFFISGKHKSSWKIENISGEELWDIKTHGVRAFRMLDDKLKIAYDLYKTATLFLPGLTHRTLPEATEKQNLHFMKAMAAVDLPARKNTVDVDIDPKLIHPGDFFGILRLDGLDPMLAWAMGGTHTGHTTIAMQNPETKVLEVCESTTKDSYWPTNGVQCTEYTKWIYQARKASMQVVWLPLKEELREKFDNDNAYKFFKSNEGLNYGFGNLLWGWVDFKEDNYPYPLTSTLHYLLPVWIEKLGLKSVSSLLWTRAFNNRLGTKDLGALEAYEEAASRNMSSSDLMSMEEKDSFLYLQKHNNGSKVLGRSMVCDVFVCEMWRAGGLFGDLSNEFDCTEATNWDIYTLTMFDVSKRPQQCKDADPELDFCQLAGKYQLSLPHYNSRKPVKGMWSDCPRGEWPDFNKPVGC